MAPLRVLLTGFGPFPKVAVNVSASFVQRLARAARRRHAGVVIRTTIIPTEWHRGLIAARSAIERFNPDVILHFGVSDRAQGFVIERQAVNACGGLPDALGNLAAGVKVEPGAHRRRAVTVPVGSIVRALKAADVPVSTSTDAGQYLCNAVLYQSLGLTRPDARPRHAGFIHMPAVIADNGPLDPGVALRGGLALLEVCLEAQVPKQGLLKT